MKIVWTLLSAIVVFVFLVLLIAFICFLKVFYLGKPKPCKEEYPLPVGKIYEPYYEIMIEWIKKVRGFESKDVSVVSFDGLTLRGRYYERSPNAPLEILFHGYKGSSERDLIGGVIRCFSLGHNVLLVDQRAGGRSDGRVTTFGAKESRDCLVWVDFVIKNINKDAKIIITGVSMGAATVMIAASAALPENVVGVLADCGYTSAEDIIKKVMKDMNLPPKLVYPFVKLGAKLFGGFDLDDASPIESMKKCRVPVMFVHGDTDDFVPHEMSIANYNACVAKKHLVIIEKAGHGLGYPVDSEKYVKELKSFFDPILQE